MTMNQILAAGQTDKSHPHAPEDLGQIINEPRVITQLNHNGRLAQRSTPENTAFLCELNKQQRWLQTRLVFAFEVIILKPCSRDIMGKLRAN